MLGHGDLWVKISPNDRGLRESQMKSMLNKPILPY